MRIGILGGGQLAMMMVDSANEKHKIEFTIIDPTKNPPASKFTQCIQAEYTDLKSLDIISEQCDLVTIDFENVPADALKYLQKKIKVFPEPDSLEICQDRLKEKNLFQQLGIPTTNYKEISSRDDLKKALEKYGSNSILKSRRFGYDGKNQIIINDNKIDDVWEKTKGTPSIIENKIDFETEVSLIGVRTHKKEFLFYPLVENHHIDGILSISLSPINKNNEVRQLLQKKAEAILKKIMNELNYIGVLVIEFFLDKNLNLIANEIAPRVHNSGHWTIQGANISQFEAHIRAICDIGFEKIETNGYAAMMNLISKMPDKKGLNLDTNTFFYDYGKDERDKRKLGHITIIDKNQKNLFERLDNLKKNI